VIDEPKAPVPEPPPEPVHAKVAIRSTAPTPSHTEPPPVTPPPATPDSGGGPVVHIDNLAPDAKGTVPVRTGPSSPHVGRGGNTGGGGAGSGQGSSDAPPPPVSVAMIKKAAMPRGDFGYMDASKDYPPEARQLGIEGDIQVRLVVDDKGGVKSAILRTKLGHGLDELALARAKKLQFEPAIDTDGKPVASVVVWTFHMTLPK
jgi:protein TonB